MIKFKNVISTLLSSIITISCVAFPASSISEGFLLDENLSIKEKLPALSEEVTRSKISPELEKIIENATEDDLIPIYIFKNLISDEEINEYVITETGMDCEVYENPELFEALIVPQVEKAVETQIGREKANKIDLKTQMSPMELEINNEVDKFLSAKRDIVKREYIKVNESFIEEHIQEPREIFYNSKYTSTIAIEATPAEIMAYLELDDVEEIAYFEDFENETNLNIVLTQIGADSVNGTKNTGYNGGIGYKGDGIKIGIIESGNGKYDSSSPHLSGLTNLSYVANVRDDGTTVTSSVTDHATMVTAIIVGKEVKMTISGTSYTFEGIVPNATVYQTASSTSSEVYTGFQALVNKGVNVINYSGSSTTVSTEYNSYDKEIDRLISTTNVTFVNTPGNTSADVRSPGKAINAITVGNVETKSSATASLSTPYSMNSTSAYTEETYLPNKPDISAPGTNITRIKSSTEYTWGSGTSYAAPLVTGIVAQSMQRVSALKTNPYATKSFLILCADASKISTTNNSIAGNSYLREKSGAGLAYAKNLTLAYTSNTGTLSTQGNKINSTAYNYTAGQKIRAVLVFGKKNTSIISSSAGMDDIDLNVINSDTGVTVASSINSRNNIEIVEFTIPSTGNYYFQAYAYKIVDSTSGGVPYSMYWRVIS